MSDKGEGSGIIGVPSREKYWEEMDAEQKIETLREFLAQTCRLVAKQDEVIAKLLSHHHSQDGGLMVPIASDMSNQALGRMGGPYTHDGGIPYRLRDKHERR